MRPLRAVRARPPFGWAGLTRRSEDAGTYGGKRCRRATEREAMTKVKARITNGIQRAQSSNEPGNGGRAGGRFGISDLGFHWVLGLGHLSFAD
jgi:hypothetical protein